MYFHKESIGHVGSIPIFHHSVTLEFKDYDNYYLKKVGKKPKGYHHFGEPVMRGLIIYWERENGGLVEDRIPFKEFWHDFERAVDWDAEGGKSWECPIHPKLDNGKTDWDTTIGYEKILDTKYTEVIFQVTDCALCPYDRVHERVDMYSIDDAKKAVANFDEQCKKERHKYMRQLYRGW